MMKYSTATFLAAWLATGLPCHASSAEKGPAIEAAAPDASRRLAKHTLAPPRTAAGTATDLYLARLAKANKANPAALTVIQKATPAIKAHPEKYVGADGQVNQSEIVRMLTQKMGNAGPIVIPGRGNTDVDESGAGSHR